LRNSDAALVRVGSLITNSCNQPSTPAWTGAPLAGPHRHAVDHGIDRLRVWDVRDAQFLAAVFADQHHAEAVHSNPKP